MIPKECKRLAEVDFPVAEVSRHSAREKSIRHGHPSTLHLWWARRPLASSRAMLMALLLPDPVDEHCPKEFRQQARKLLQPHGGKTGTNMELRQRLLKFIADFANWDNSAKEIYLTTARGLVKAAHGEEPPLVVDPFAGGGSIPLEALRVGCDAFASDLNPVACLILKVMLEDIPRHGPKLAEELRRVGKEIKEKAEKELAEFYPPDPDGARPIAYLWARTVRCESPNCGAEIPLTRSPWLCKKAKRKRALRYKTVRPKGEPPRVELEIFEPAKDSEVLGGTVDRAKASCLCCGTVLAPDRVRAQLSAQRGGADVVFDEEGKRRGGARMLAVVTLRQGETGRFYRLPTEEDYQAVRKAQQRLKSILEEWERQPADQRGLCPIPDEPLPPIGTLGFRVQRYGMTQWGDLFTVRQKVALVCLTRVITGLGESDSQKNSEVILEALGLVVGRVVDKCAALVYWHDSREFVDHVFARQALIAQWNTAEAPVLSNVGFEGALEWIAKYIKSSTITQQGQIQLDDAAHCALPSQSAAVWFTDPPYYDAIPYSDLSDFFLVWLKRALPGHPLLRDPFDPANPLSPKAQEAVQDETKKVNGRPKDRVFFEEVMAKAFGEGRRVLQDDGVGSVVFAHKTTEGWEALLSGMTRGGWTITGSWPITTEMATRLRARESAALSASVHLVCRPRTVGGVGGWEDILRELPDRIGDWMERLAGEGIRGADLVFSCIGPALELFSKYDKVETAEGREVTLAEFLEKVWEVVGRTALQQVLGTAEAQARNGLAGALEEDARLTALFLWTLQSTNGSNGDNAEDTGGENEEEEGGKKKQAKGYSLIYDVARRFAQPLGIHMEDWEGRIIENKKGTVRLLSVAERSKQLFGEAGAGAVARAIEKTGGQDPQFALFPDEERTPSPGIKGRRKGRKKKVAEGEQEVAREATTLDRVHAAMLLQSGGQANALRALLKGEIERGPDFLRLANALSGLYPKGSEELRLLEAMILVAPK